MPHVPSITEAEWPVMKVLWDRADEPAPAGGPAGPGGKAAPGRGWLAAADIVEPVARDRGIHHRTVRTLLARLVKKGAVETRLQEPAADSAATAYWYKAKVPRDAVVKAESESFLSRVFDGNAAPALVHLLHESRGQLSPQDLQQLRALLNAKEKP
jgi:BlaI family penicillinase repressor